MDVKDFRKFVLNSPIKEKLDNIEVVISYSIDNNTVTLKGIQSIYKFLLHQVKGWNSYDSLPKYLNHSKNHFENLKSNLISLTDYFTLEKSLSFDREWGIFYNELIKTKINSLTFIFLYDIPESDFLIQLNLKNSSFLSGAIDYLTHGNLNLSLGKDYITGLIIAYEFKNQSDSEIHHRRNNEKISLGKIRDKYNEYIVEAEQQLNGYLSDAKENLTNHFESVDKLKSEKKISFEEWFSGVQTGFDRFFVNATETVSTNEDLYKEKLRLEAPAKYWKDRSIKLKAEGNKFLNWLIGISIGAAILLFALLMLLGNDYFDSAFNDKIKGIKWSLILVTIVSLLAFTIKILSKMTFSSFHLSRDAEEREQLTHFYLALKKDTTIEPEERQLILQSLFSRADTGLLKEDSSPTMPTSIIEKFSGNR